MPSSAELPPGLARFAKKHALEISDARWRHDRDRLIKALERIAEAKRAEREVAERAERAEAERAAGERAEAEREAAEREAAERAEREAVEQAERQAAEREAAERVEREVAERAEAAGRGAAEHAEREPIGVPELRPGVSASASAQNFDPDARTQNTRSSTIIGTWAAGPAGYLRALIGLAAVIVGIVLVVLITGLGHAPGRLPEKTNFSRLANKALPSDSEHCRFGKVLPGPKIDAKCDRLYDSTASAEVVGLPSGEPNKRKCVLDSEGWACTSSASHVQILTRSDTLPGAQSRFDRVLRLVREAAG
jgi:hypothetical protein